LLIFPARISYDTTSAFLCFPRCIACMIIRWTGQPLVRALGGLRITHYGSFAGREKVGWICSLIMRFFAFSGMIFSRDCAWSRNRRDIVIVAFCSRRHLGLHLAFVFLAQLLFRFISSDTSMIPFNNSNKHLKNFKPYESCL
jgi:hypothetical protein